MYYTRSITVLVCEIILPSVYFVLGTVMCSKTILVLMVIFALLAFRVDGCLSIATFIVFGQKLQVLLGWS